MKKLFEITLATLLFSVVMLISVSFYKSTHDLSLSYNSRTMILVFDLLLKVMFMISSAMLAFLMLKMANDYFKNYEKPERRPLMFHSRAEVSWVEVEYDPEGEEIRRNKHSLELVHNMCRTEDDNTLDYVVQSWHTWRRANDKKDAKSAQDLCDYINMHTLYKAATTKEEFYQLLKGKS